MDRTTKTAILTRVSEKIRAKLDGASREAYRKRDALVKEDKVIRENMIAVLKKAGIKNVCSESEGKINFGITLPRRYVDLATDATYQKEQTRLNKLHEAIKDYVAFAGTKDMDELMKLIGAI